jgi:hypothetical protein
MRLPIVLAVCAAGTSMLASTAAEARPRGFVEGLVGWSYAMGDAGYLEERQGPIGMGGVRAGVLFRHSATRRWGFEVGVDRTSFAARYDYYVWTDDTHLMVDPRPVRPAYERTRFLAGARLQIQASRRLDLLFRGAIGLDRVTGDMNDDAFLLEPGLGMGLRLGPVRLGIEGSVPMAMHNGESYVWPGVTEPANGRRIGYMGSVDLVAQFTVGATF